MHGDVTSISIIKCWLFLFDMKNFWVTLSMFNISVQLLNEDVKNFIWIHEHLQSNFIHQNESQNYATDGNFFPFLLLILIKKDFLQKWFSIFFPSHSRSFYLLYILNRKFISNWVYQHQQAFSLIFIFFVSPGCVPFVSFNFIRRNFASHYSLRFLTFWTIDTWNFFILVFSLLINYRL